MTEPAENLDTSPPPEAPGAPEPEAKPALAAFLGDDAATEEPEGGNEPDEAKPDEGEDEEKPDEPEEKPKKLAKAWASLNREKRRAAERFRETKRLQAETEAARAEIGAQRQELDDARRMLAEDPLGFVEKFVPNGVNALGQSILDSPSEADRQRVAAEKQQKALAAELEEIKSQLKQREEEASKRESDQAKQQDLRQVSDHLASKSEQYPFAAWYDKGPGSGSISAQVYEYAATSYAENGELPDFDEVFENVERQVRAQFEGFPGASPPAGTKPGKKSKPTAPASTTVSHNDTATRADPPPRETPDQRRARIAKTIQVVG